MAAASADLLSTLLGDATDLGKTYLQAQVYKDLASRPIMPQSTGPGALGTTFGVSNGILLLAGGGLILLLLLKR